jgi:hypothetical protein
VRNYFLVESATILAAESTTVLAAESTTAGAAGAVSTAGESVFGASDSEFPLQAAKDTDTIAKAKITFFIFLICLNFKIII